MKKLFALLLTVVMMASMMVPAMAAYTEITPGATETINGVQHTNVTTIPHSLQLTRDADTRLDYTITYSYDISNPVVVKAGADGSIDANLAANAVTGKPSIAPIVYTPDDVFSEGEKICEKTLIVDWTNVKIKEPGIYRWDITQSYNVDTVPGTPDKPSNAAEHFYLYMYVTDYETEDGGFALRATPLISKSTPDTNGMPPVKADKPESLPETYPAKTVDLEITKTVAGTQGSKEQYFPFTITLTAPQAPSKAVTFQILATPNSTYTAGTIPATAYHGAETNPSTITLPTTTNTVSTTVWLKHGQSVTIHDLIYGTQYTITEGLFDGQTGYNAGYTVTATTEKGNDISGAVDSADPNTVKDTDGLKDSARVDYTNTKELDVPTGISLQSGAAFFGIVLAMGMMVLLFVGKRKEQNF